MALSAVSGDYSGNEFIFLSAWNLNTNQLILESIGLYYFSFSVLFICYVSLVPTFGVTGKGDWVWAKCPCEASIGIHGCQYSATCVYEISPDFWLWEIVVFPKICSTNFCERKKGEDEDPCFRWDSVNGSLVIIILKYSSVGYVVKS